ncbi:MAG: tetratricopeptide repeat protein [Myxococcaceae bacterium]
MRFGRLFALLLSLSATIAFAQISPDRELEAVRQNFNAGNYKEALDRARTAMETTNFDDAQRIELHKYAGVAAFNLGDHQAAEAHFLALLKLNPDYVLDPFAYPPPIIKLFEEVKRKSADTLNLIRQQIALRDEQARRDKADAERRAKEAAERASRLEQLSKSVTVRTVEKRSWVVNFLPFGAGQFQQNRGGPGIFFAGFEGAMAVVSIVAFIAIQTLYQDFNYTYDDRIYPVSFTVHGIRPDRAGQYQAWNVVKLVSGGLFYLAWVVGAIEALAHHQDEVVTTEKKAIDELEKTNPSVPLAPSSSPSGPKPYFFGVPGGGGGGVELKF